MSKVKFIIIALFSLGFTFAQSEKFVPIDNETLEFVGEVNYTLYANRKPIFFNLTSKDSITRLPKDIVFDSIVFSKMNYKTLGFRKEKLSEVILLTKTVYELDELIIPSTKPKEILIGEESKFVRKQSGALSPSPDFGILFREYDLKGMALKRMNFFVEKVKYKTTYKIKFYAAREIGNLMIIQHLKLDDVVFESPVLTLEKGTNNKVEIDLQDYTIDVAGKDIFVCLELQAHYDENNNIIQPTMKEATHLKFQCSNLVNYYCKTYDLSTQKQSNEMVNINAMINRDFATMFFKKPHKSTIVTPAIILYAVKK